MKNMLLTCVVSACPLGSESLSLSLSLLHSVGISISGNLDFRKSGSENHVFADDE